LGTGFFVHHGIVSAVKREFVSDIVLDLHAGNEKSGDSKESFYEELEQVFYHFPKYHMEILLGDFKAKVGRENIFKPTMGHESVQQDSNDNGVRIINFPTSKNLVVKSTMFMHQNNQKHTWTSHDGQTHNQIDQILIGRRWHSSLLDVLSSRVAGCDTDQYVVVAKVRERGKIGSK
jgi:hypothetical protein